MRNTKRTSVRWRPVFLALLLAGTSVAVWPQEAPDEGKAEAEAAPAVKQTADKPPADKKTSPPNNNSPFDYQASEEISQDLSVSWPVDI